MKKVLFIAVAVLGLASCKKDYTCSCKGETESESETLTGKTKEEAKEICDAANLIYQSGDNGSCSLK